MLIGSAQNSDYNFKHLTVTDGLISNNIITVFQDREGFMWIGTQTGLQRFDGKRFKNYVADIRDTAALQSDWISSIFEDSKDRLWFGSDPEGPYLLNRNNGSFYNYNLHAPIESKINGIWTITEDKNGSIWIAGHDGIFKLNNATNQFENYNIRLGFEKNYKTGWLHIDSDNNLWISTVTGVKMYDQQNKKLYDQNNNPLNNPLFNINESIGITQQNKNDLWVTSTQKVYKYNFLEKTLQQFTFSKRNQINATSEQQMEVIAGLHCLADGNVIVALSGRGLAIYEAGAGRFNIIEADNSKSYTYHVSKNIFENICIVQDKTKCIFIGSGKGINMYSPEKQFFQSHKRNVTTGDLFPSTAASDFLQLENGNVLLSYYYTNGGIVKIDSALHFKKHYLVLANGNIYNSSNQTWNLFKDDKGIIWAPNQHNSILKLNLTTEKIIDEKDTVLNGPIIIIKPDTGKIIWMGHWNKGLVRMNLVTKEKQSFTQFIGLNSNNKKRVLSLLIDADKIWVGTNQNGLQVFDKKTNKFTEAYVVNAKDKTSISNNSVTDILQYTKDTLILATLMGIDIFDKQHKTFKAITAKDGLPNNLVQSLIKDDFGNVWIACYTEGLCKLNMHDFSITKYDINDGITDNVFGSKFYKLKNGRILLGVADGFISFDPSKISISIPPYNVRITGMHVLEKEKAIDSLIKNDEPLILTYKENSVRIEFASFEYWNPGTINYYYKLEGVDKDWVVADFSNTAVYNQLKEGRYVFKVKCANREGVFSKEITTFKIIITPPFWKTWWFIILLLGGIIFLILFFIKVRVQNIKAIEAEKLKVQQLKAEQYKGQLELEQIINYFSSSLIDKHTIDDVLWDIAKNLIGRLGFVDCMIYLWNDNKTKMIQKAGHGLKASQEEIRMHSFDVLPGQGVVGYVMQTKTAVVIGDTTIDARYRTDDLKRLSEITVPIIYNDELLGVLDTEHPDKHFFNTQHLQLLTTIATLIANKIRSIEAEQLLQNKNIEMYSINEQLSIAKLEALRSQMNPHFIFNSLNAIQECILTNKVDAAYKYLSKFSKLQRMVLNNSQKELIPLSSELEMLQLYLSLESLRFSKSFVYHIDTKNITDTNEIMIPSLITQPLVENAIWHGLRNKEGDKELKIIYEEKDAKILIIIDDNGIGREAAAAIKKQKLGNDQFASKAMIILQQRLQVLSQQLKADIGLETIDKKNGSGNATGTQVIISFPANLDAGV